MNSIDHPESATEDVPTGFTSENIDLEIWACIKHLLESEQVQPSSETTVRDYSTVINRINEIGPELLDVVYQTINKKQ